VPVVFRGAVLKDLVNQGALEQRTGRFLPKRHQVSLSKPEQDLLDRLVPLLDQPQPPSLGDIGKLLRTPLPETGRASCLPWYRLRRGRAPSPVGRAAVEARHRAWWVRLLPLPPLGL
jgi:hypothetical protein